MLTSFLSVVIRDLLLKEKSTNYTIILPSKRAVTFFKKEFAKQNKRAQFLPKVVSIDTFIEEVSGLRLATPSELQYHLYAIYRKSKYFTEKDSFEAFLKWGGTIIQDFNEIDRYLIDEKSFFYYLKNIQELKDWGTSEVHWAAEKQQTTLTNNYLTFWSHLHSLYREFNTYLNKIGKGYQGLIYKTAYSHIKAYIAENNYHYFIGFNALNEAEKKIIKSFEAFNKGELIVDADTYYLNNPYHSAGLFLRSYKGYFFDKESMKYCTNDFITTKELNIINTNKSVTQVKYVGDLVSKLKATQENLHNTAIVLADESLLIPLLNSLPMNIGEVNITMGIPLHETSFSNFFEALFKLHLTYKENEGFYYKSLLQLINQNEINDLLGAEIKTLEQFINSENVFYLKEDVIKRLITSNSINNLLFSPAKHVNDFIKRCILLIIEIKDIYIHDRASFLFELTVLQKFYTVFRNIEKLEETNAFIDSLQTLHRLFRESLSKETLDLQGNATSGLQIMGMLETRVLDFETIILLSVNEGVLPSGKSNSSFITYDMKVHYKLPTYKEKDAIYSYHFYRMLQRCEKAYLLYNSELDVLGSGEKSRFITQLIIDHESGKLPNWKLNETTIVPDLKPIINELVVIEKNENTIKKLNELAQKGFSPSALTSYIRNPIDFYKQKVLDVNEYNNVEETVASNTLGTIIHNVLETLYTPFVGKYITIDDIKSFFKQINSLINNEFKKIYKLGDITKGKNLIIYHVSQQYIKLFLKKEIDTLEKGKTLKILHLEKPVQTTLELNGKTIILKGIVDRIDELDGCLRIIDYKTGKVNNGELEVYDWESIIQDYKKFSKAFQILMYAYILNKESVLPHNAIAGIISFKNLSAWMMPFAEKESPRARTKNKLITPEILSKFETQLEVLLKEIFDIAIPFTEKEI